MNNILITVSGPSGGGKSSVIRKLVNENKGNIMRVSTYTTRPKRSEEESGNQYEFITQEKYDMLNKNESLIAPNKVNGYSYACPVINMNDKKYNEKILLLDIGVKGASELKKRYNNIVSIYIIPPNKERLKNQMVDRDSTRWYRNLRQIKEAEKICDWLVINDKIDVTTSEIKTIAEIIMEYRTDIRLMDIQSVRKLYKFNMYNEKNKKFLEGFYNEKDDKIKEKIDKEEVL